MRLIVVGFVVLDSHMGNPLKRGGKEKEKYLTKFL
jgi:hypothetical protein